MLDVRWVWIRKVGMRGPRIDRKTCLKLLLFSLIIPPMSLPLVEADVDWFQVSPEGPVRGDVLEIRIKADPGEGVPVEISFTQQLQVTDGEYELRLDGVVIPSKPNAFTVKAANVENLHVSVKILFWITKSAKGEDGVAALSQGNVPVGTYDIIIRGDAAEGASTVHLQITASTRVTTDQDGFYEYIYDTRSIPPGNFTAQVGSETETFTLLAPIPPTPPPEDLATMPEEEAVDIIEGMEPEEAADLLDQLDPEKAAAILSKVQAEMAAQILEASVNAGLTPEFSDILLKMDEDSAAHILTGVESASAILFVEQTSIRDLKRTATIMELAAFQDEEGSATILQGLETDALAGLLLEMVWLPSKPATVATILGHMILGKVVEVVRAWLNLGALQELGIVFDSFTAATLNSVYMELTDVERDAIQPHLSEEALAGLGITPVLPLLPDLTVSFKTIPTELHVGEEITIEVELFNIGGEDSGPFTLTLNADDLEIGSFEIQGLTSGSRTTARASWKPTTDGEHTLKVAADHLNQVGESDEANNIDKLRVMVKPRELSWALFGAAVVIPSSLILLYLAVKRRG